MNSPYNGRFQVTQEFKGADHDGLDLVGLDSKEIHSTVTGTVRYAGWENSKNHKQGFGQYVCIKNDADGYYYYFGHMSEIKVSTGDAVKIGDVIGIEGDTGYSFGSHCHYCVRKKFAKGNFLDVNEISGIPNTLGVYNDSEVVVKPKEEVKPEEPKVEEPTDDKKDLLTIAFEVIEGKWDNNPKRKENLTKAGYDYDKVQELVNELLKQSANASLITNGKEVSPARSQDSSLGGEYKVAVDALNMRFTPNKLTSDNIIKVLRRGETVKNYGFYTQFGNSKWLLIRQNDLIGWVSLSFLIKEKTK